MGISISKIWRIAMTNSIKSHSRSIVDILLIIMITILYKLNLCEKLNVVTYFDTGRIIDNIYMMEK